MFLLTNKTIEKLKHDLVREGVIKIEELTLAQENAQKNSTNLADELIKTSSITEKTLLEFIESKLHIPCVDLNDYTPDKNCLEYISLKDAQTYNIFPLFKIEDVLTIAMSDPLDLFTINTLFEFSEITIEPVVCAENSIKMAIKEYYLGENNIKKDTTWQDELFADNINDESLEIIIDKILDDAITKNVDFLVLERSQTGLNIFFNKDLAGFIPNIIVPRFIYVFQNITKLNSEIEDVAQNSRFSYSGHTFVVSAFPTKFGLRITLLINKPLKPITNYGFESSKIDELSKTPSLIGILAENFKEASAMAYSLAEYLSSTKTVLLIENKAKYELNGVTLAEFNKNTAVYFDEILEQIDLQNFEVIFWDKVYTEDQAKKLKLLSKEKLIFTAISQDNTAQCDYCITTDGKIKY